MPPKPFEGKFGIPPLPSLESLLNSALYDLPESVLSDVQRVTQEILEKTSVEFERAGRPGFHEQQRRILQLKLARYYQKQHGKAEALNIPTIVDALVESPRFLDDERGGIKKLLEMHEVKTLQKIAEQRRRRAEIRGDSKLNPYEILFETENGKYYLARLLNMPHLEEESAFMSNCVGTSDSYINKMKRGEVEIFSLRNKKTHKPVVTIEYDTKSGKLLQVMAAEDSKPSYKDPFFGELLEAIDRLGKTMNDEDKPRRIPDKAVAYYRNIDAILAKNKRREPLNKADLMFLYAIGTDSKVGFNNVKDPRVQELLSQRNPEKDMPVIFDCEKKQIARSPKEINESTKAYVGPLFSGIFDIIGHLEHIYTSLPEGKITRYNIEIGGKTAYELIDALERAGFQLSPEARYMLKSKDFSTTKNPEQTDLVCLTVGDLFGDKNTHTTDEIYEKADRLGLELCPAEVGPHLRLKIEDQSMGEWVRVAMKPISDPDGGLYVFNFERNDGGLWLSHNWAKPRNMWNPGNKFVFRLRSRA